MISRMIHINLTYNSWFSLVILFSLLILIYLIAKRYFEKKIPTPTPDHLKQLNRELIKIDEDLRTIKELENLKK